MAKQRKDQTSTRLSPQTGEIIDRTKQVTFTFNGQNYSAHPGDTIASALVAAGVNIFSRSFKYHRPRGLLCCSGHCPNCLVQVGDEPSVRACTRPVAPGMAVTTQNAWPSLDRDIMSLTRYGDRLLPVGFYYKTFIRPQRLWPLFERLLRQAAGLGRLNTDTPSGEYDKQYLHPDLVVVGGGPAGLSAALAAAREEARVLLIDENPALGGHLRYAPPRQSEQADITQALLQAVEKQPGITVYHSTTVLGWYEDNWLSAAAKNRLYKIRAGAVVFACGAYEQPLLFENNDLPGIMLGSGVQRLVKLYGVAPGRQAVVITANDDGWVVAADLQAAGITVVAVADERLGSPSVLVEQVTAAGVPALWGHSILSAEGSGQVEAVTVVPVDEHGQFSTAAGRKLPCDLVAVSAAWSPANGLLYQAGVNLAYDEGQAEFLPGPFLPDNGRHAVFAAGRVTGDNTLGSQIAGGQLAGRQAAAFLGLGQAPGIDEVESYLAQKAAGSQQTSKLVVEILSGRPSGHGKQFLCYCEDVTKKDLELSIAEGYDSIELLKRYSTISMGPCQGKMCSSNTIHLCARANGRTIAETGTTTARPPMRPVSLGVLAGQTMEPVQLTPLHDWHVAHGARMMVAGLWLRPEHYGDPEAEIQAVRRRVGLIDVSTLGKLGLSGPGVPGLLERLYTNRWQNLAPGRARYGLMCNDEGIILDDGVTARISRQKWYTTTTSSGATAMYEWIQWWLQSGWGSEVHLANLTEVYAAFNLAGPDSRAVLQLLADTDLSSQAFPYLHVRDMTIAGAPCRIMRIGFTGELSYEIHCPAGFGQHVWQALMDAGQSFGIQPSGVEAQRVLRLEKGHIIVGQDTDALSDPLAADMAWAVKLDKPDFLGQRPLARLAAEGTRQRLVGFKTKDGVTVPDEGLQIVKGGAGGKLEIIGWVTSSRFSPTLNEAIGLCWLPADIARENGASFFIRSNGRLLEATVHHGPFYDPAGERLRM